VQYVLDECKGASLSLKGRVCVKVLEKKLFDCYNKDTSRERE